jgi:hypothetical protein
MNITYTIFIICLIIWASYHVSKWLESKKEEGEE